MANPLPNQLALTSIADGSQRLASPIRNNFSAVQTAVNALRTALASGTAGQVLQAVDGTDVQWQTLLQLVDTSHPYKIQFGSSVGTTNGSGVLAVTYAVAFASTTDLVLAVNGDTAAIGAALLGVGLGATASGFNADFGSGHASTAARVNWIAIGH